MLGNAGQDVDARRLPSSTAAYAAAGLRQSRRSRMTGVTVDGPYGARTNTTITEPDGTTTKVNEPGPTLSAAAGRRRDRRTGPGGARRRGVLGRPVRVAAARRARRLVRRPSSARLKPLGCKVAVDTSDAALDAVLAALPEASFDLIKPNTDELAQLTGGDAAAFEAAAKAGDAGRHRGRRPRRCRPAASPTCW